MIDEILEDAKQRMEKSLDTTRQEMALLRTGRASTALLDGVKVEYYGTLTPLKQLANIFVPEARLLAVQPYEKRIIGDVEKAILKADLGLNPMNDGNLIRIPIPELSEERRQELVRFARKLTEEGRVAIRNIRRDANDMIKSLEKEHDISEDNAHDALDKVQELTDKYIKKLDDLLKNKEKEILEE